MIVVSRRGNCDLREFAAARTRPDTSRIAWVFNRRNRSSSVSSRPVLPSSVASARVMFSDHRSPSPRDASRSGSPPAAHSAHSRHHHIGAPLPVRSGNFVASRGDTCHPLLPEYQHPPTDLKVRGSTPLGRANPFINLRRSIRQANRQAQRILRSGQPLGLEASHLAGRGTLTHQCPTAAHPTPRQIAAQPLGIVHVFVGCLAARAYSPSESDPIF